MQQQIVCYISEYNYSGQVLVCLDKYLLDDRIL